MSNTNLIASPAPRYLNFRGYRDVIPFEVVRVISDKTLEIREMQAERDPTWVMDSVAGGFCRHVENNDSQRWIITSNLEAPVLRARRCKDGRYSVNGNACYMPSDKPVCFYDYNY